MKLHFHINYHTQFGEELYLSGSHPTLGDGDHKKALRMSYQADGAWYLTIPLPQQCDPFNYEYHVKKHGEVVRQTILPYHFRAIEQGGEYHIYDRWQEVPLNRPFFTSAFTQSFLARKTADQQTQQTGTLLLAVNAPTITPDRQLALLGGGEAFGDWKAEEALIFDDRDYPRFTLLLESQRCKQGETFKLGFINPETREVTHWEEGENRLLRWNNHEGAHTLLNLEDFRDFHPTAKYAGTAIPLFSLRSEKSFGIGDFGDLYRFVDWMKLTGQNIIQILPINDTTMTHTWVDSYPYNANSIYALHPAYIDLTQLPSLMDAEATAHFFSRGKELNQLEEIDYDATTELKWDYLRRIFAQEGGSTLASNDYKEFFQTNREWLTPYAVFSSLRDKYSTPDFRLWSEQSSYKASEIERLASPENSGYTEVALHYYIQYQLHLQLTRVRRYAHYQGVILKGDIPIGISRNSVEAWKEPHLFHMDSQAGAPPDDFSAEGQNWGFPTYNWEEMAKDNYAWWRKRFQKMADYFDAYRIDHLLGFFRIWEIPLHSVQGLLGYFNPAMPFSRQELEQFGFYLNEERHTRPFIMGHFLDSIFGEQTHEVMVHYLDKQEHGHFTLKEANDTQRKIEKLFEGVSDPHRLSIKQGLMGLCNEVLFVRDPKDSNRFHPRISAHFTQSYQHMELWERSNFNELYTHFFYERHNDYWKQEAMLKLPALIEATNMLVCAEDLGMIPDCVPEVINELQVLSLEIQRMPKDPTMKFAYTNHYPYLSVGTTSTHDMATLREWWEEDREATENYFRQILWRNDVAPTHCEPWVAEQIVRNHLTAPAMLSILPLQDWMAIDGEVRRTDPRQERINVPANPRHYWRYRMHLTIEELIKCDVFNNQVKQLIRQSGR